MSYVYDAVGNRTQRTDYNGVLTNYAYDNLNRLTTITYPTRSVTYSYDPLNNMTRATNENGSVYIGYDNRYRVSSFSDPFYYGISYNYDTVGNRTALKVNGATYATYTYDTINRLTTLKDSANLAFNYNYDAANRLTSRSAPNGVISSYGYDDLNRLTSLMHTAGATTLSGNLYTYNNANNISNWTTQTSQKAYTYDAVDRLTSVSNFEAPAENYSYDAVGNRTASQLSATYGYQPLNRLASTTNATYSYDNNGNLISKTDASGVTSYTFNEENQLTQVSLPGGLTVNYKFDGLGRRIQRMRSQGANERYIYDHSDVLIDLNSDWSVSTTYLNGRGIDNHLRQTSNATGASYFLTDHLGSTSGVTDASGNMLEPIVYDSFGNHTASSRTRYTYTGRERDPDTGLMYYRARFYDPQIGRFIGEDPIGLNGGANPYSYALNIPNRLVDPVGLDIWDTVAGAYLQPYINDDMFLLGASAHAAAGFGDEITGGFADFAMEQMHPGIPAPSSLGWTPTGAIRDLSPGGNPINRNSGWYRGGQYAGLAWGVAMMVAGAGEGALETAGPAIECECNTNPFNGPVGRRVIVGGPNGDAIPVNPGEQMTGSPNGKWLQVRDAAGNPTGLRLDGPHRACTHPDLRAQQPHGHVPGVTNADGTPWLPGR